MALGIPARHECCAGGCTYGTGRDPLIELDALLSEQVYIGCVDCGIPVGSQVRPSQVIDQQNYYVGWGE